MFIFDIWHWSMIKHHRFIVWNDLVLELCIFLLYFWIYNAYIYIYICIHSRILTNPKREKKKFTNPWTGFSNLNLSPNPNRQLSKKYVYPWIKQKRIRQNRTRQKIIRQNRIRQKKGRCHFIRMKKRLGISFNKRAYPFLFWKMHPFMWR